MPFCDNTVFTNGTAMLQYGPTKIVHNIRRIEAYKSGTKVEYFILKNMSDDVSI